MYDKSTLIAGKSRPDNQQRSLPIQERSTTRRKPYTQVSGNGCYLDPLPMRKYNIGFQEVKVDKNGNLERY